MVHRDMDTVIREAIESDFEQLKELFIEENKYHSKLVPDYIQTAHNVLTQEEFQSFLTNQNYQLFVCEKRHELLGAVLISLQEERENRWKRPRTTGFIEDLIVTVSARRCGIGTQLIKAAEAWVVSQGIQTIELHVWEENTGTRQFYESIGFLSVQRRMSLSVKRKSKKAPCPVPRL